MVGGSDALARNLNHIENYAIGISKDLEGMTMEGYAYYAKHSQSFEGVSLAFQIGGPSFRDHFTALLQATTGDLQGLQNLDDARTIEYVLKEQWASAVKQLVAIGDDVTNGINKAKMLKHTTEATMAAFNLKEACSFRLRQIDEIENNGKTRISTKIGPDGEQTSMQVTETLDDNGHKTVTVTSITTSQDGAATDSKKTTASVNADGSLTLKTVSTSNSMQSHSSSGQLPADRTLSNPI